jgi:hypothetical protein
MPPLPVVDVLFNTYVVNVGCSKYLVECSKDILESSYSQNYDKVQREIYCSDLD